jgi:DNA-binding NarL/FixJ family response regulator
MMKLLVVDGRHDRRQGMVAELARIIGVSVQGAVPSYSATVQVLASYTPDILVVGTDLGDGFALDLLPHLASLARRPAVLVVGEPDEAERHMQAGADRYIVLGSTFDRLSDAVIAIARERSHVSPQARGRSL